MYLLKIKYIYCTIEGTQTHHIFMLKTGSIETVIFTIKIACSVDGLQITSWGGGDGRVEGSGRSLIRANLQSRYFFMD
jgi:hypothetical protein